MFGVTSPPRDLLPSIVLIKSRPSLTVFLLSSVRLSYFFRVALVLGCSEKMFGVIIIIIIIIINLLLLVYYYYYYYYYYSIDVMGDGVNHRELERSSTQKRQLASPPPESNPEPATHCLQVIYAVALS